MTEIHIPKFGDMCPFCRRSGLQDLDDTRHTECRQKIYQKEQLERSSVLVTRGEMLDILNRMSKMEDVGLVRQAMAKLWKIDV